MTSQQSSGQNAHAMAKTTPGDAAIPRYLRDKANKLKADDCWDEELERANAVFHERVARFHRDKLCTGYARYDWRRTRFYTRDIVERDVLDHIRHDRIPADDDTLLHRFEMDVKMDRGLWPLHGVIEDNIQWHAFEFVLGVNEQLKLLGDHPRFQWELHGSSDHRCTFCNILATFIPESWQAEILGVKLLEEYWDREGSSKRCIVCYKSACFRDDMVGESTIRTARNYQMSA